MVAAVPIGYADGLNRLLSNRQEFLLHGQRVRQIGRVCMDMCMIDVTDIPDVKIGDVVTIFGEEGLLQEKADTVGTITYEMMCAVAPVYLGSTWTRNKLKICKGDPLRWVAFLLLPERGRILSHRLLRGLVYGKVT